MDGDEKQEAKPDEATDPRPSNADLDRKREVFGLLDAMDPHAAFETVSSWIRRRLNWYEEHFAELALTVDRAERRPENAQASEAAAHERKQLRNTVNGEKRRGVP